MNAVQNFERRAAPGCASTFQNQGTVFAHSMLVAEYFEIVHPGD